MYSLFGFCPLLHTIFTWQFWYQVVVNFRPSTKFNFSVKKSFLDLISLQSILLSQAEMLFQWLLPPHCPQLSAISWLCSPHLMLTSRQGHMEVLKLDSHLLLKSPPFPRALPLLLPLPGTLFPSPQSLLSSLHSRSLLKCHLLWETFFEHPCLSLASCLFAFFRWYLILYIFLVLVFFLLSHTWERPGLYLLYSLPGMKQHIVRIMNSSWMNKWIK